MNHSGIYEEEQLRQGEYYVNRYIDVIDYDKDADQYTRYQESNSEFRQAGGSNNNIDWDEYSEETDAGAIDYGPTSDDPTATSRMGGPSDTEGAVDTTDICIIAGTELDNTISPGQEELLQKMWICAKPPTKLSIKRPIVTARQLEIVRGQLTGELPRKSHSNFVRCDEETCAQICKYVGIIKGKQKKSNKKEKKKKSRNQSDDD